MSETVLGTIVTRYKTRDVRILVSLADDEIHLRPEYDGDLTEFAGRLASVISTYPDVGHIEPPGSASGGGLVPEWK